MTADLRPGLLPVAATLLALAGIRVGETVVDAGCGDGLVTHPAAAAVGEKGQVYGVDPDHGLLAAARARRPSAVGWVCGDAGRLPFADGTVDKVVAGSLHGVPDVRPVLAEAARVLVSGGRVVAGAWGEFGASESEEAVAKAVTEAGGKAGRRIGIVAGIAPREAWELPDLLREAGLRVVYRTEDGVALPFPDAASYAAWRLSFPRGRAAYGPEVARRVAELLGEGPVTAHARVHFASATTTA